MRSWCDRTPDRCDAPSCVVHHTPEAKLERPRLVADYETIKAQRDRAVELLRQTVGCAHACKLPSHSDLGKETEKFLAEVDK